MWIINTSLCPKATKRDITSATRDIVGDLIFNMGISGTITGFYDMHMLFKQANDALRLGQEEEPHFWHYQFEDYLSYYLLERFSSEYPHESICHPGIKKLLAHDKAFGTRYVLCLKSYISQGFNITQAAKSTFMHRSTLIRNLERIKKLTGINLTGVIDAKDFALLCASLELMDTSKT